MKAINSSEFDWSQVKETAMMANGSGILKYLFNSEEKEIGFTHYMNDNLVLVHDAPREWNKNFKSKYVFKPFEMGA